MIFPNKFTKYDESVIAKLPYILKNIKNGEKSVFRLYELTNRMFDEIDEFIYALDILYLLDKIDGVKDGIIYVKTNK